MGRATRKRYSSSFKFETVMEAITSGKVDAEVARSRGVHPVTLSHWKKELLGRKEVELALAENFFKGRSKKQ